MAKKKPKQIIRLDWPAIWKRLSDWYETNITEDAGWDRQKQIIEKLVDDEIERIIK